MKLLPPKYDHKETEHRWQQTWLSDKTYAWDENETRENSFVIDTPPPTVSGLLHMGHIFSYTQADFVARFQRMSGKSVFYPMGFDDNGLPTERLVEKVKKVRATDMSREAFIELCEGVAEEARIEFRKLFQSVALSVDWDQEYHTISDECRKISQLSFLDLFHKEKAYRKLQPMLWDPVDQTAIAQAEVEDKEEDSLMNYIHFGIDGSSDKITIATTRPELLAACVAVFYHPDDERYQHLKGKTAVTAIFGVKVPLLADENVKMEKGSGLVMCCTFGDETDILWWKSHNLPIRGLLNKYGKISFASFPSSLAFSSNDQDIAALENMSPNTVIFAESSNGSISTSFKYFNHSHLDAENTIDITQTILMLKEIENMKVVNARTKVLELVEAAGLLADQQKISHAVKCAERSGATLEYLNTTQWFIKILDQKEELKAKAAECNWYPEYMKVRIDQWIDGLSWDWCISRQRFFGVPFPVWYLTTEEKEVYTVIAKAEQLPVNPLIDVPAGFERLNNEEPTVLDTQQPLFKARALYNMTLTVHTNDGVKDLSIREGEKFNFHAEKDVMDTWATSSVSPQLNSKAITKDYAVDYDRHKRLFPADLRPQAHEIIRTWAFYTIAKAHLHEDTIPWKNLMISGWCLAADKTKMSKSKGNVVTPVDLIENKGSDTVRYWASTSRLGSDTAYSEDVLKIGGKLINKLWNASKFATLHFDKIEGNPSTPALDMEKGIITEAADKWILTRLARTIDKATMEFEKFEYCKAREAIEDFFWNDFCDNYLELVKVRSYRENDAVTKEQQQSAIYTLYHSVETFLRLFAPFVPHITEELYSHLFDEKYAKYGSIHHRGSWPQSAFYAVDAEAENSGIAAVSILNAVRKLKAEKNVSIKWPLDNLAISAAKEGATEKLLTPILADLKSVTNSSSINWTEDSPTEGEACTTEDGIFCIVVQFAKESDAA